MPQTRPNKAVVPINSDAYNLVTDLATMADSMRIPIKVASSTERDALPSPQNGDKVIRTDLAGQPFETYDLGTATWLPQVSSLAALSPTGYSVTGTFYKISLGAFSLITATLLVTRTGSSVVASGGGVSYQTTGQITPSAYLGPASTNVHWMGFTSGSGTAEEFQMLYNINAGTLSFRGADGGGTTNTWITNGQTNFSLTYMIQAVATLTHLSPPSRWEKVGRALAYLFTALIGFGAVWFPRALSTGENTNDRLGMAVWIWAGFMASALPAAVATLMGRHRIEFVLIPLFTVALAVANVNAWVNVTYDPTIMARACASSALICLLCVRWIGLNRLNRTPFPWTLIRLSK